MAPLRVFRRESDVPLTAEERRWLLRAMVVIAIPLATMCVLSLSIGGLVAYHYTHESIQSNERAIHDAQVAIENTKNLALALNGERRTRERALAWQVYDECVENENQDAANASLFRKVYRLVATGPPSPAREDLLQALQQTIDAREPPGEQDCAQPSFPRPTGEANP